MAGSLHDPSESPVDFPKHATTPPQFQEIAPTFRFPLGYILYAVSVIGAFLSVLGESALWPATLLLIFWATIFFSRSRVWTFQIAIVPFVVCFFCCGFAPLVIESQEGARRMQCAGHFKTIAMALHLYHDRFGSFPPAFIPDESGKPMHSWRVLILPYVEEMALYSRYQWDEPWDGPHNRLLAAEVPRVFQCPSQRGQPGWTATSTNYLAIVGDRAAWPESGVRNLEKFPDGIANTIHVMESEFPLENWMEPTDISAAEAIEILTRREPRSFLHHSESFFFRRNGGRVISLVDADEVFVPSPLPRALAEKLVLVDDDGPVDGWQRDLSFENRILHYHYGNLFRLGVLLVIVFALSVGCGPADIAERDPIRDLAGADEVSLHERRIQGNSWGAPFTWFRAAPQYAADPHLALGVFAPGIIANERGRIGECQRDVPDSTWIRCDLYQVIGTPCS